MKFNPPNDLIFLRVALLASFSEDDDAAGGVQSDDNQMAEITFFQEEIILPQGLQNQTDSHAQELVSRVESIKSFGMCAACTQVPPGAEVSPEPITATGTYGRPASASSSFSSINYTVYTYSYGGEITSAYQFSEQDGMEVVEIFYSSPETNNLSSH